MVRKYRLTRKGRLAVVYGMVGEIQEGDVGATMTQVARSMGLKPSTYVAKLLDELWSEGVISYLVHDRANGGIVKEWFVVTPEEMEKRGML